MDASLPARAPPSASSWYTVLYSVLIAIAVGVLIGHYFRDRTAFKRSATVISLIKMRIGLSSLHCSCTASARCATSEGRPRGVKTLFYFETVSTLALRSGCWSARCAARQGLRYRSSTLDAARPRPTQPCHRRRASSPTSCRSSRPFIGAFARGDLLQVCWCRSS